MKELFIKKIIESMRGDLSALQLEKLKKVIGLNLKCLLPTDNGESILKEMSDNMQIVRTFLSAKKVEGCSDKSLHYYQSTIYKLLKFLNKNIKEIKTDDIRTYLSSYRDIYNVSKVTIDNERRVFSSFFAWLEDEDFIVKSPVRRIHKVKTDSLVKEVFSDENIEFLRDACKNKRDLALIDLLSSTGIRIGELVNLDKNDIDFHERECKVFGKGSKERIVYFNARTKLHILQYLDCRKDSNNALFVSLDSPYNRLSISGVEHILKFIGSGGPVKHVYPHKFRRTFATMAIDKGMPIEQVQKILGHVRIDTTLKYAVVNQNNIKISHHKFIS